MSTHPSPSGIRAAKREEWRGGGGDREREGNVLSSHSNLSGARGGGVSPLVGWVPQARRGGGPEAEGKAGEFPATEAKGRPPTPSFIHFI